MKRALHTIDQDPELSLNLLVTGMHLLEEYGETWKEISESGLSIGEKVPVKLSGGSGSEMSIALGEQVIGFTKALERIQPDVLLLLGDRGEMMAGALAALHLNIVVAHIHGGELSGTVDESIRHAISKLAHYHMTATQKSCERLISMGEQKQNVFVTGAPGLDDVYHRKLLDKESLFARYDLNSNKPLALVLFHPVVQRAGDAEKQTRALLEATCETDMQNLVIAPNADSGSAAIVNVINEFSVRDNVITKVHLPRDEFLSFMAYADVFVGNSSSGIIESASVNTPVVNIGNRQNCRERNLNVVDAAPEKEAIVSALQTARDMKGQRWQNVYGDGAAAERIVDCLKQISLSTKVLEKINAY
jgi:GDP/UDP-N,N'-diacetylbacillosamine 2-epimerase (hydrolysing)